VKVISNKIGSSRERVDVEVRLSPTPNWRIDIGGQKHLVMYSAFGSTERNSELWLTEAEALWVAKVVSETVLAEAASRQQTISSKSKTKK
jgi:hypothetical protein